MNTELGICCRCGEEIGPPFDRDSDCLCKQCYDDTHKVRPRHHTLWGSRWLKTPSEREDAAIRQEKIDERIDKEMRIEKIKEAMRQKAKSKFDDGKSQISNSVKSSAE